MTPCILRKALAIDGVVLQHGTYGGEGRGNHAGVGGGEKPQHLVQQFVQLPGGEPQGKLPQIFRNVLGNLRLSGFQSLGELHRDLVAPVRREKGRDGQKCRAGHSPYYHILTDLDEIGKVGGDVQQVGMGIVGGLIQQVFHSHRLQHPGRGRLEIIQKNVADGLRLIQPGPEVRSF